MADYNVKIFLHGKRFEPVLNHTSFYLTYLIAEFPSVYLLQRFSVGLVLCIYMMGWGI